MNERTTHIYQLPAMLGRPFRTTQFDGLTF
jgi:hypothetical protein